MELEGTFVLVTGAAGGVGSAITAACARQSAHVAAVDRVEATSDLNLSAEAAHRIVPFLADISTAAGCDRIIAEVLDRFGTIDGLVNCAGVMRRGALLEINDSGTTEVELAGSIPRGRLGRPREVAELTTYLRSNRASFISGAAVEIAGAQQVG